MSDAETRELLRRIADALDRLAPEVRPATDINAADAFVWDAELGDLKPVKDVNHVPLELLCGIDLVRDILLGNTERFARGLPANNALLWGARGMGKSSLIKAVHADVNGNDSGSLVLIEIHREDIASLPRLLDRLRRSNNRTILYCDDLSFERDDATFKSLKAVLEGGIEGRPTT